MAIEPYVCPKCGGPLTKYVDVRVELPLSHLVVTKTTLRRADTKILWVTTRGMDILCTKCERVYMLDGKSYDEWKKTLEVE
jgi:hypothetical protein